MAKTKSVGTECKLYIDTEYDVSPGDVIKTSRSAYRVIKSRLQNRGKYAGIRWHLITIKMEQDQIQLDDSVHEMRWYRRGYKRW